MLIAVALSPLLWASVPPLVDYPNHLARMWILFQDGRIPELASNYLVQWRLLPNLAIDFAIPALAQIMPLELAGRVFIALTLLGLVAGTATLHYALYGRLSLWPMCALLFIYNTALFWGFLNFLFGLAMFLLSFSAWIATARWPIGPRLIAFAIVASTLLVLHLFAFGMYGLSVMSYELGRRIDARRLSFSTLASWCALGVQFIPALLLWAASVKNGGPNLISYGSVVEKLLAAVAPVTFGVAPVLLDFLLLILCIAFLLLSLRDRFLKLAPDMRLPLATMMVVAVLMPNWLSGSWNADIRLPIALPFVIIASTRLEPARRRTIAVFAVAAVAFFGARIWSVSESWRDHDRHFAEFRAASRVITPGARLLIVQERPASETAMEIDGVPPAFARRWEQTFWHMPALAVIDRAAFIPYMFTGWAAIQPNPRNDGLFQTVAIPLTTDMLMKSAAPDLPPSFDSVPSLLGELPYFGGWPNNFDYVLRVDFDHAPDLDLTSLRLAARGSFFQIYRVIRP